MRGMQHNRHLILRWRLRLVVLALLLTTYGSAKRVLPNKRAKLQNLASKRILRELKEVAEAGLTLEASGVLSDRTRNRDTGTDNGEHVRLGPLSSNLLEWHFTVTGPAGSVYEGGLYHGRVLLAPDYPASAPRVQMLTPNGRFAVRTDICLSASSFHQETWDPAIRVHTLVSALRQHLPTKVLEIGGIEASAKHRMLLAKRSRAWVCPMCGCDHGALAVNMRQLPETRSVRLESVGALREREGVRVRRRQHRPTGTFTSVLLSIARRPLVVTVFFVVLILYINSV